MLNFNRLVDVASEHCMYKAPEIRMIYGKHKDCVFTNNYGLSFKYKDFTFFKSLLKRFLVWSCYSGLCVSHFNLKDVLKQTDFFFFL